MATRMAMQRQHEDREVSARSKRSELLILCARIDFNP